MPASLIVVVPGVDIAVPLNSNTASRGVARSFSNNSLFRC
jgi:hypothetical protein